MAMLRGHTVAGVAAARIGEQAHLRYSRMCSLDEQHPA